MDIYVEIEKGFIWNNKFLKIMEGYYENFHLYGETWRIAKNRRK